MHQLALRGKVSLVALVVALAVAISIPLGYGMVAYLYEASLLAFKVDLSAGRVERYIYSNEKLWQYQKVRLAEIIERSGTSEREMRQRILDTSGNLVAGDNTATEAYQLVRSAPLTVAGQTIGRVEANTTLRPLLARLGLVSLFSFVLGFAVYFAVRILPLRVVDRTLESLRSANRRSSEANAKLEERNRKLLQREKDLRLQNQRFDAALENMSHGLSMFDNEKRLVIANAQYEEMYALPPSLTKPGSLIDNFHKHVVDSGIFKNAVSAHEVRDTRKSLRSGERREMIRELADGRMFTVAITGLADGGWVAVHKDTTERTRREEALRSAEAEIRARSAQLIDAQRIGKIGDWYYRLGEPDVWWAPEIYDLLAYDPASFRSTREAVMSVYIGDGPRRVLESQAEVLRTKSSKGVDVKVKRGDGSIGDFVVTSKALMDAEGSIVGFSGTIQDITERKVAEAQLEKLAFYDPLTGLANRALFLREINDTLTRCQRSDDQGALLLLDLDRFKEVNDSLGHGAGDELLVKVASLIRHIVGSRQFVARLGGDEFAVILRDGADQREIDRMAGDIVAAVSGSIMLEGGEVNIGTSIGIVVIPRDGADSSELLRNADLALYRAKDEGRGRFAYFSPDMNVIVQNKIALARDLRTAVADDAGLYVHFQPQIDLSTGLVTGYESLMRWRHPERGNVSPAEFIPIAESSRLICDLGLWILRASALQAKAWLDAGEPPREVSVNVSAAQIWHTDMVLEVERVLQETGLPPHLLCLELTESLLVDHAEGRVRSVLKNLKKLGVTLALDDFGTDYSSLGYLIQLPFDKLKIDRIFIDGVADSDRARELLKGIVALGRGLGMTVVGEGAEKAEEVEILRNLGCDLVQGYFFARPTIAEEARAFANSCEEGFDNADTCAHLPGDQMQALVQRLRSAAA